MNHCETCLLCGTSVPEGIQVCPACENEILKGKSHERPPYGSYIFRGDVFFADLNPVVGCETGGIRPVVIIQNDVGNRFSDTVIAAVTSRGCKRDLPVHVPLDGSRGSLTGDTVIMLEQIRTIDKRRLKRYLGHLDEETMARIDSAASCSIGLNKPEIGEN